MQNAKWKIYKKSDPKVALEIVDCEMIISSRALQR